MRRLIALCSTTLCLAVVATASAQAPIYRAPKVDDSPLPPLPSDSGQADQKPQDDRRPPSIAQPNPNTESTISAIPVPIPSNVFWRAGIASRVSWINSAGFDAFAHDGSGFERFSTNRTLVNFHLSLDRTVIERKNFTIAAGGVWEFGSKSSEARGADSKILVHRLGVSIEPRFHFRSDLYFFGRVVPQAIYTRASLQESSLGKELRSNTWGFGTDISAGASWNFFRTFGVRASVVWLSAELGYGITTNQTLDMKADYPSSDPRSQISLPLGDLSLRGPFLRTGVGATF